MRATDPVFFVSRKSSSAAEAAPGAAKYAEKDRSSACWLGMLGSHASETPHLFATGLKAEKGGKHDNIYTSPYCHGKLCLMPGGDFPTRKAVLDAVLCGCVPVTFQRVTAQEQWPWHWVAQSGKIMADDATIYIDREEFFKNPSKQFENLLRLARNASFVAKKRLALQEIRSQMQYRLPHSYPVGGVTAKRDAVDVILDNLFTTLQDPK